jgi:hypothetical protein
MRLLACVLALVSAVSFAQSAGPKLDAFRDKVLAERKKLGLDKKNEKFPTPEVKFLGTAVSEGVNMVVCPGASIVVNLEGIPAKSLVLSRSDDVEVSKESWAGTKWTGTLTAKKTAGPHSFVLDTTFAGTGQQANAYGFLIGCPFTLTFTVDGATMVAKGDLRSLRQEVTGEWKKGGKVLGTRNYTLTIGEQSVDVSAMPEMADQERLMKAMQGMMESPKMKAIDVRFQAAMKKIEACTKLAPEKMMACMTPVQAENEKIGAERNALMAEAEIAGAPLFGCMSLNGSFTGDSEGSNCAGHRNGDRLPMKWSWTAP